MQFQEIFCFVLAIPKRISQLGWKTLSPANRARLLSVSSRHAAAWLSVIPSVGLNLHHESDEFQIALKWWLGMDTLLGFCCPYCPEHQLDHLGHHAVTCKGGGDVVLCHNSLRDVFSHFCHRAHLGGQLDVGCGTKDTVVYQLIFLYRAV